MEPWRVPPADDPGQHPLLPAPHRGLAAGQTHLVHAEVAGEREAVGGIPAGRELQYMDNQQIIDALVPTRGIGRWTVEMMLMFRLGRPDVLPIDDLGIRKGIQLLDGLDAMPAPKDLPERAECWTPYQSMASFYLWRIADFRKTPVKRSQD